MENNRYWPSPQTKEAFLKIGRKIEAFQSRINHKGKKKYRGEYMLTESWIVAEHITRPGEEEHYREVMRSIEEDPLGRTLRIVGELALDYWVNEQPSDFRKARQASQSAQLQGKEEITCFELPILSGDAGGWDRIVDMYCTNIFLYFELDEPMLHEKMEAELNNQ